MEHPFKALKNEYAGLLASMTFTKSAEIDAAARRLLRNVPRYTAVHDATGIPVVWIAASFDREASSNFDLSPAQGDPWRKVSMHVPKGRGPFTSWYAAALDAYRLNALDKVGADNWSWELACFYGELFNGFGYRDYRGIHSPYLWGGTNHQQKGKYTSDGKYDPDHFDAQLGIIPVMKRMVQIDLLLDIRVDVPAPSAAAIVSQPTPVGLGGAGGVALAQHAWGAAAIQAHLNKYGVGPLLLVDGNYGKRTWLAARNYQISRKIAADGFTGPQTIEEFEKDLAPDAA